MAHILCRNIVIKHETTGTHHCHGLGAEDLWDTEGGVEGDVGEGVHDSHEDDGDSYGSGQVPDWVLQFLYDEVEIIPAVVSKQAGVEGESNLGEVRLGVVPVEVLRLPLAELDHPGGHDHEQSQQLGVGEHVLDCGGPLNTSQSDLEFSVIYYSP